MSDWDRFVNHDPELDRRASTIALSLVRINRDLKTCTSCEVEALQASKQTLLAELIPLQIKRGVMKGPEDK